MAVVCTPGALVSAPGEVWTDRASLTAKVDLEALGTFRYYDFMGRFPLL